MNNCRGIEVLIQHASVACVLRYSRRLTLLVIYSTLLSQMVTTVKSSQQTHYGIMLTLYCNIMYAAKFNKEM